MDDIFVYTAELPQGIQEFVTPCSDGYTIYLNKNLCPDKMAMAYLHALEHIRHFDFEGSDVQEIEAEAHRTEG